MIRKHTIKRISTVSMGWDKHGTAGTYHRVLKYTTTNDIPSLAGMLPTATWHLDSLLERWVVGRRQACLTLARCDLFPFLGTGRRSCGCLWLVLGGADSSWLVGTRGLSLRLRCWRHCWGWCDVVLQHCSHCWGVVGGG